MGTYYANNFFNKFFKKLIICNTREKLIECSSVSTILVPWTTILHLSSTTLHLSHCISCHLLCQACSVSTRCIKITLPFAALIWYKEEVGVRADLMSVQFVVVVMSLSLSLSLSQRASSPTLHTPSSSCIRSTKDAVNKVQHPVH
jgi:hypothetical protein